MIKDISTLSSKRIRNRIGVSKNKTFYDFDKSKVFNKYKKNQEENMKELLIWKEHWDSLYYFRKDYLKACDYVIGNQLEEIITYKGARMTKRNAIKFQGKTPVVVNVIFELMNSILGSFSNSQPKSQVVARGSGSREASDLLTNSLHSVLDLNQASELDIQQLQIFLASGAAFFNIQDKWHSDILRKEAYITVINPCEMFFNSNTKDVRGDDIYLIGQIIETTRENAIATFAKSQEEIEVLNHILEPAIDEYISTIHGLTSEQMKSVDFFIPTDPSNIRIYLGWQIKREFRVIAKDPLDGTKEEIKGDISKIISAIEQENKIRYDQLKARGDLDDDTIINSLITAETRLVSFWTYKFLTKEGYCLEEGESPFEHKSHPYVFILRPLINGEVYGFLKPLLQIQDVINEQYMMLKWLIEASAKGLLMIPTSALEGSGYDINDWAEAWTETGGVIAYTAKQGVQMPTEITSNSTDAGIKQMLDITIGIMDKIGGISKAAKGQEVSSGTPASLYYQMAQNSSQNIATTMKAFESLLLQRDTKVIKVEIQLREDGDYVDYEEIENEGMLWKSELIKDMPFKVVVKSGADNPVYKMTIEETLLKLLETQNIDLRSYLKNSTLPFASTLLRQIEETQQQLQQGV